MTNPTAAIIVIGDEILSGRTRDANMHFLAGCLSNQGIRLCEVRIIADDHKDIVQTICDLRKKVDYVFTSGGIGPTHDDITADAVAAAFNVGIDIREDAKRALSANYPNGLDDLTPARLRMARIPDGARLIKNSVSGAPGFIIENVYVMAGVPNIFQAMVHWVMPQLSKGLKVQSLTLCLHLPESVIAEPLGKIAQDYSQLSIGSYPFFKNGEFGANIVLRGQDKQILHEAYERIKAEFNKLN